MFKIKNKRLFEIIINIILSLILTIFVWQNISFTGNSVIFVFILMAIFITGDFLITKIKTMHKREIIIISIISFIFSVIELIGKSINTDYTLNNILNKWIIVDLIGYFIICAFLIANLYDFFEKQKSERCKLEFAKKIKEKFLNNNIKIFFICLVAIIIAWLPYYLNYFPGILTPDSCSQIEQIVGKSGLSNHHPITHTGIVAIFVNIAMLLFKDINMGIALYSLMSIIIMALLDTFVIMYMVKNEVDYKVIICTLIFYMFYPVNGMYSITMWKDVFFSGVIPIFIILNIKLLKSTNQFFEKRINIFLYLFISILTMLLRHNGVYVVLLTLPFIFGYLRSYWKKILPFFSGIIILYLSSNFLIYNILQVEKGSIGEMLSVPVQQIARVEKENRQELDIETKEKIEKFFGENIGDVYNPTLSDDVKGRLNGEAFETNKVDFFGLWLNLLLKYPKVYIESFISNSYGYYYPEAQNWVVATNLYDRGLGMVQTPIINSRVVSKIVGIIQNRNIPIISMFFSVGFASWLLLVLLGYKLYRKEKEFLIIYLPLFILWLTLIASPVFCEYRYAYSLFLSIPLLFSENFKKMMN